MKVKDTFEKFIRNTKYHQNSEVWHNGWNIGYEGKKDPVNPHSLDTNDWYSWCEGYFDGRDRAVYESS